MSWTYDGQRCQAYLMHTIQPDAVLPQWPQVDDHRQPAFRVTAGIGREWVDEAARTQLAARVRMLTRA